MDRRTALKLALAAGIAPVAFACRRTGKNDPGVEGPMANPTSQGSNAPSGKAPSIFLAHGSPLLLDDQAWVDELAAWGQALPRPRAILMISAHWVDAPITLGATKTVPLVYDFYGFPARYSQVKYPAPGAPELAARVHALLQGSAYGPVRDSDRGLDHGAYVPLVAMYPRADVPVLQMSIPTMDPAALLALGRALAPLRREGVLVVGSGFLTHNMHAIDFAGASAIPSWASEFDAWSKEALMKRDVGALESYREKAPGVRTALPTHEHFVPVLVSVGTSLGETEAVSFPITGFTYGSFTKRSVQFG
jgi:4,5-DOPA dioxygenase extradiol